MEMEMKWSGVGSAKETVKGTGTEARAYDMKLGDAKARTMLSSGTRQAPVTAGTLDRRAGQRRRDDSPSTAGRAAHRWEMAGCSLRLESWGLEGEPLALPRVCQGCSNLKWNLARWETNFDAERLDMLRFLK